MSEQITPNPSVPSQVVADGLKFPKFVNNLGIIPTSYKDSMSYYECLAWLCKYLEETVIPTVNQNGDAVEELQGLYIELNEYVDHYFDTLDVQEEINNKLDEMVADGTLNEVFEDYFNPKVEYLQNQINALANGAPLSASSTSEMTDTTKIYVNTSDGYWYYYNGEAWTRGEIYQATIQSVDYKNEMEVVLTDLRSLQTYDLIEGHRYRFFNTGSTYLTLISREPDQVTQIEIFVEGLRADAYIEFEPTETTNCLFTITSDTTDASYKIVDLGTIDERINYNKNSIENFSLNNLSELARNYYTKGYVFKEYEKQFQKVALEQNGVVSLVKTTDYNCFSVIIDLEDFTNSLNVSIEKDKFDTAIRRFYLVKEDNTNSLTNWAEITSDVFITYTKAQLESLISAGWKYMYLSICNSTDDTFVNNIALPLEFDFYIYDTKPTEFNIYQNLIIVDSNGSGDYTTISDAVSNAYNYDTIYIRKGTYNENVVSTEKTLYFIGEDKFNTVLVSNNGLYNKPPLEIASGIIKNMTIKAEYISGVSNEPDSNTTGSYGIHADFVNSDNSLIIENCIVSSDFFPAIGIGLHQDKTIEIKDCTLISNQETLSAYISSGTLGALYFHNQQGNGHDNQKLVVTNCKLKSKKENVVCGFDVNGASGVSTFEYEFSNNVLYSETTGYTDNIWWRNGQFNFIKSPLSFGNSNSSLNAI